MLSLRDFPELELGEIPLPVLIAGSDPVPPPPPPPPPPPSNDDPTGRRR